MTDAVETEADDLILPFSIELTNVRGRIVRLGRAVDAALVQHDYPDAVAALLGEALVLAVMLGSSLKFDGKLILQMQGDGPVGLVVADYRTEGTLRGYAQINDEKWRNAFGQTAPGPGTARLPDLMGEGHLAITVDPRLERDRYQGIVSLTGKSLSDCARYYFAQSEQLPTEVQLAVAEVVVPGRPTTWRAGGLVIQALPEQSSAQANADALNSWETATALFRTTEAHELIDPGLDPARLLYRLFHEMGVRVYDVQNVGFACSCDRANVLRLLASFPDKDQDAMLEEDGRVHVRCEFCGTRYRFAQEEIDREIERRTGTR